MAHNFVSAPFPARYVRLSTRLAEKGALSRSASKYRPRALYSIVEFLATCFVKAPFRNAVTYDLVRSLLRKGLFRASHPNAGVGLGKADLPNIALGLGKGFYCRQRIGALSRISSECRRRAPHKLDRAPRAQCLSFEGVLTKTPSVTSLDTMLSYSECA